MKKIHYMIFLTGLLLAGSSCTKDFTQLNTDPNSADKVLPQNLLARSLVQTISNNLNRTRGINNELMQVTVNTLVETDRIFRYDIRRNVPEAPWNGWYAQLTNFKDIYRYAKENTADENASKVYMGISLICQTWVHSILTDTFGDTPYEEANRAREGIYTPVFDRQQDIYAAMFRKLEEANELLKGTRNVEGQFDPVYKGNVALWRKFGNSLYLRLLLRVSGKAEVAQAAQAKIKEIVETNALNYPIIAGNTESAILRLTGVDPYISPFSSLRTAEWNYPKACSFFVEKLEQTGDPCLSRWVTLTDGLYEGIPSGYTYGETPEGKSVLQPSLIAEPLLGNMLNYAEVQFILAEASARGWLAKPAQDYYQEGIIARATHWGRTASTTYLNSAPVKLNTGDDLPARLEKIHWQKYLSLFFTDMQQWIEYRRTGHPELPRGQGLRNDGIMPARLYYPISIQATNGRNYEAVVAAQGPDDLKTQVWWQKP